MLDDLNKMMREDRAETMAFKGERKAFLEWLLGRRSHPWET